MASILSLVLIIVVASITTRSTKGRANFSMVLNRNRLNKLPQKIFVRNLTSVTLECPVKFYDKDGRIRWTKDGVDMKLKSRGRLRSKEGSLYFRRLKNKRRKSDAGTYRCYASNKNGTIIVREVSLLFVDRMKLSLHPQPMTASVGGVARFACRVDDAEGNVHYRWEHDGSPVVLDNLRKFALNSSGILHLINVLPDVAGLYRCKARVNYTTGRGNTSNYIDLTSQPATLSVTSSNPTLALIGPPTTKTTINATSPTTMLECLVNGVTFSDISWSRYYMGELVTLPKNSVKTRSGSLLIPSPWGSEISGVYICTVRSTPPLTISTAVNQRPYLSIAKGDTLYQNSPVLVLPLGMKARFACYTIGTPQPRISWYKDGHLIDVKDINSRFYTQLDNQNLASKVGITMGLSGYYQCLAQNSQGHVMSYNALYVYGSPDSMVTIPDIMSISVDAQGDEMLVFVAFRMLPYTPNTTYFYTVTWERIATDDKLVEDRNRKKLRATVTAKRPYPRNGIIVVELERVPPNGKYYAFITVYGQRSTIGVSRNKSFSTYPGVLLIRFAKINDSPCLKLSWDASVKDKRRAVNYRLSWREMRADVHISGVRLSGSTTSYTLKRDIKWSTSYELCLLPVFDAGWPVIPHMQCRWQAFTTPKKPAKKPKLVLNISQSVNSEVMLTWDVIGATSRIREFKLFCRITPLNGNHSHLILPGSDRRHTFTRLKSKSLYVIDLIAVMDPTPIKISANFTTNFRPTVVNPVHLPNPTGVFAVASGPHSINISWSKATSHSSTITAFIVICYVKGQENKSERIFTSSVDSTSIVIEKLEAYTTYVLRVASSSPSETGPYGPPVLVTTQQAVPSAPRVVSWRQSSNTSIVLSWHDPKHKNGVISRYIVRHSVNKSSWVENEFKDSPGVINKGSVGGLDGLSEYPYYFKVSAETLAGEGPSSSVVTVQACHDIDCYIHATLGPNVHPSTATPGTAWMHDVRVIIAVSISVVLLVLIVIAIIIYIRCCRHRGSSERDQPTYYNGNGTAYYHNGHAGGSGGSVNLFPPTMPMLSPLPENKESDTKGDGSLLPKSIVNGPLSCNLVVQLQPITVMSESLNSETISANAESTAELTVIIQQRSRTKTSPAKRAPRATAFNKISHGSNFAAAYLQTRASRSRVDGRKPHEVEMSDDRFGEPRACRTSTKSGERGRSTVDGDVRLLGQQIHIGTYDRLSPARVASLVLSTAAVLLLCGDRRRSSQLRHRSHARISSTSLLPRLSRDKPRKTQQLISPPAMTSSPVSQVVTKNTLSTSGQHNLNYSGHRDRETSGERDLKPSHRDPNYTMSGRHDSIRDGQSLQKRRDLGFAISCHRDRRCRGDPNPLTGSYHHICITHSVPQCNFNDVYSSLPSTTLAYLYTPVVGTGLPQDRGIAV